MKVTGWGAFWLFVIIFFFVDFYLFNKGYDTYFWKYKTKVEKEYQKRIIRGAFQPEKGCENPPPPPKQ